MVLEVPNRVLLLGGEFRFMLGKGGGKCLGECEKRKRVNKLIVEVVI